MICPFHYGRRLPRRGRGKKIQILFPSHTALHQSFNPCLSTPTYISPRIIKRSTESGQWHSRKVAPKISQSLMKAPPLILKMSVQRTHQGFSTALSTRPTLVSASNAYSVASRTNWPAVVADFQHRKWTRSTCRVYFLLDKNRWEIM